MKSANYWIKVPATIFRIAGALGVMTMSELRSYQRIDNVPDDTNEEPA